MPHLVAAATDQTGRTIMMLSAGLVAVAIGLTALTIWYWRFTSPRRRAAAISEDVAAAGAVTAGRPVDPKEPQIVEVPPVASPEEPVPEADPPPSTGGAAMGLDSEQWAMLTQAVMDEYLDS